MKKRSLFALALLLLVFTGGRSLPAFAADSESPAPSDSKKSGGEASKDGDSKSKKPADVSGGHFSGDPIYVHLPVLVLPVLGNTGPEQLVTVQITVEVKDFDTADSIHSHMPRVMDALLQNLYGGIGSGSLRNGRLIDVGRVKNKAMSALQTVEGNDNIKDVLIMNLSQRML